jgi:hypothetical protein
VKPNKALLNDPDDTRKPDSLVREQQSARAESASARWLLGATSGDCVDGERVIAVAAERASRPGRATAARGRKR